MFSMRTRHGEATQQATSACGCPEAGCLAVTIAALVVCWWALIEIALGFASIGDDALAPAFGSRLILVVCGLAVLLEARIARSIFCFLCAMSVLAIAPALVAQFAEPLCQPAVALIDCATKLLFLACTLLSSTTRRNLARRNLNRPFTPPVASSFAVDARHFSPSSIPS